MKQKIAIGLIWSVGLIFLVWTFSQDKVLLDAIEEVVWFCLSTTVVILAAPQLNSRLLIYGWFFYCTGLLLDAIDDFIAYDIIPILILDTSLKSIGFILVCYGMLVLLASKKDTITRLNLEIASREQLEQRLRYEAFHDALTGIGNRKACFNEFDTLSDRYTWLYYFDLDNFKHANDEYGHHIGDEILCNFTKKLTNELESEAVFRIGGDEFVAFTNLELEDRDTLRTNLSTQLQQYQVGVSIGAAKTNKRLEPDKILQQADAKMYRDKSRSNK